MTDVYNEQIQELSKLLPSFKLANATIHYDETSPHMHVIGVPVIENCKRGMKNKLKNHSYLLKPYFLKYKIKWEMLVLNHIISSMLLIVGLKQSKKVEIKISKN